MVKKGLLLLSVFFLMILAGCTDPPGASAGKIIPPLNQSSPLGGKWEIMQELGTSGYAIETSQQWTGGTVQFAEDGVEIGGHVWDRLSYKIKRVNAADYLMTKYIPFTDVAITESQEVDVITVYAASKYLGEFMKLSDEKMISFVQNKGLLLRKLSDEADSFLGFPDRNAHDLYQDSIQGTSGILMGIKIPYGSGYRYRTLWVATDYNEVHPVLAADQLFFPRTSGFWELQVQSITEEGKTGNILTARNVTAKTLEARPVLSGDVEEENENSRVSVPEAKDPEKNTNKDTPQDIAATDDKDSAKDGEIEREPVARVINYIGNNYIAIEKQTKEGNRLQVLPVDKLSMTTEIKIHDLMGHKGLSAYLGARERAVSELKKKGFSALEEAELGQNFGLVRKYGHWFLVGRVNYEKGGIFEHSDFDLKIIPPSNLIYYDTLVLSWHNIKDRVPDALDAFASPNRDVALVKTKNKIIVYQVISEQLAETPLAEIDLLEGTSVVMAEWATGSYVDNWEKSFLAYGAKPMPSGYVRIKQ
ncbi:hypothetical protein FRZ06_00700 [Anoxybacterium hadale]|uniref:Uncharacterized protein n=1 Tax=Anoxybacterium hadale TaxID=3408580 RepID=A0ACD1A6I9_9FIRM|nr:hypothetical protein FRZ06_00700 [Clostridiales bacterium]